MVDINLAMMKLTADNIESILMAIDDAHNHSHKLNYGFPLLLKKAEY